MGLDINIINNNGEVANDSCLESSVKESNNQSNTSDKPNNISGKISINKASKEELMHLSGIGEAKANKIIEYRTQNGLFTTIEDIKKVSGIGEAIFAKIKDYITV